MERRSRPDLEVRFEKNGVLIDADMALPVMHRVGRIGMDERPRCNELDAFACGKLVGCGRWRKEVREDKESKGNAGSGTEYAAQHEDRDAAAKSAHGDSPMRVLVD